MTVFVHNKQEYSHELKTWRSRLVKQFMDEGRGKNWVKDGVLQRRVNGLRYSPYYPNEIRSKYLKTDKFASRL